MILMILCIHLTVGLILGGVTAEDYCESETLQASCNQGEVIMMMSAQYGRMEAGRCIQKDYGYIGCYTDVLVEADRFCSGRQSCQLPILNTAFQSVSKQHTPCPQDLRNYLSASFRCVQVETADSQQCVSSSVIQPSSKNTGFLASYITAETDKGSLTCPWIIQAKSGQRVNITLYDFAQSENEDLSGVVCHVYAVLKEKSKSGVDMSHTVCGGGHDRIKSVFVSVGHSVEIMMVSRASEDLKYFLIKYDVFGCADPESIPHSWMKRMDQDQVMIGCESSNHTWTIRCIQNQWHGDLGNCTETAETSTSFTHAPPTTESTVDTGCHLQYTSLTATITACMILINCKSFHYNHLF